MNPESDLFRDPDDLADVLEAQGQTIPNDPTARRLRAIELFKELPAPELLSLFAQYATGFMRMVQDIDRFCQSVGATINGRIQVQMGAQALQFNGLSSGWLFDGPSDWGAAEERARAIAEELRYLTQEFDPRRALGSRETLTALGRSLQGTELEDLGLDGTYRRETTVTPADLDQLAKILNDLEDTRLLLRNAEMPPAVASALDLATVNVNGAYEVLSQHVHDYRGRPSQKVMALHNSLGMLLSQLVTLLAQVNAGRRASQERSDFLRTEFWEQRWRIYELWLLVRVLSALRDAGGAVNLSGVQNGVWNLRYGRSEAPVAVCDMGGTPLKVYYQLHVRSDAGADMPDIVVIGSQPVLVLDPKHGRSYTREKVQQILTRYAASFSAQLTAVVNYYTMRSYEFELTSHGNYRWLLASGIAPVSVSSQRLELLIRDAVLTSGCFAHSGTTVTPLTSTVTQRPASTQAFIVFYTFREVEVDEPAGFWSVRAGRGPEHLTAFERFTAGKSLNGVTIKAAPSGNEWLLRVDSFHHEDPVVWRLSEGNPPTRVGTKRLRPEESQSRNDRNSPSQRYGIEDGPDSLRGGVLLLRVVDTKGQATFPLIRFYGSYAREYLWAPDESSFAFMVDQGDEPRLMVARVGDRHATPVSLPGQHPTAFAWMTPALLRSLNIKRRSTGAHRSTK